MATAPPPPPPPKYSLLTLPDGRTRATFDVPASLATRLATAPIVTNGGTFELSVSPHVGIDDEEDSIAAEFETKLTTADRKNAGASRRRGGVTLYAEYYSPKPERTADAIALRLAARMDDPSPPGMEETCIVS